MIARPPYTTSENRTAVLDRPAPAIWNEETIPLLKAVLMNVVTDPPGGNLALAVAAMSMLNRETLRSA